MRIRRRIGGGYGGEGGGGNRRSHRPPMRRPRAPAPTRPRRAPLEPYTGGLKLSARSRPRAEGGYGSEEEEEERPRRPPARLGATRLHAVSPPALRPSRTRHPCASDTFSTGLPASPDSSARRTPGCSSATRAPARLGATRLHAVSPPALRPSRTRHPCASDTFSTGLPASPDSSARRTPGCSSATRAPGHAAVANFPGRAPCSARGPLAGEDRESPPHARLSRAEKSWLAAVRDIL